jgi:hypothetical protein
MNKIQINQHRMSITTHTCMVDHTSDYTTDVPLNSAVSQMALLNGEIEATAQIQDSPNTGITLDKKNKMDAMATAALPLVGCIQAYATDENNQELYEKVNYTYSSFTHGNDIDKYDRAMMVHAKGTEYLTEMAEYGVTQDMLDALNTAAAAFHAIFTKPQTAIDARKAATEKLEELFAQLNKLLKNKMDKLMMKYQVTNPDFYNDYVNAREIVDYN